MSEQTVVARIRRVSNQLTRSERQLADVIQKNYPASGLGTITTLAETASVSTPTVARMVQKLGYDGFPAFQAALRSELNSTMSGPLARSKRWTDSAPEEHLLNKYTDAVIDNIRQTLGDINVKDFDKACRLLADPKRSVSIVGGRVTRTLADYLFLHLQVVRERVVHIPSNTNTWPHYILDVGRGDVVVIFDIRRYENSTLRLAEAAKERGAQIILFTDQWRSPILDVANISFATRIEVPSAWDSSVGGMLLCELMIAKIQSEDWPRTRKRMALLDRLFDKTRFFRKV